MSEQRNRTRWITSVVALLVLLALLYVASYPPIAKYTERASRVRQSLRFYGPVEWLFDNTSARKPILSWARFCGAEGEVESRWFVRITPRGPDISAEEGLLGFELGNEAELQ